MMQIKPLLYDDLSALPALYRHLHSSDDPWPPPSKIEDVWLEIISSERYEYIGGFVDSALMSSCAISIIPNLKRGCRPYGIIENVVTHTAHRKQGYGTALLREAPAYAWSAECYEVVLTTGRKDDAIVRFYRSAGFSANATQAFVAKPGQAVAGGA